MNNDIEEYKKKRLAPFEESFDLSLGHHLKLDSLLNKKINMICNYLRVHNIKDVVVGFSGGADSTVTLLLLVLAKRYYSFNIHAVTIHSSNSLESSLDLKRPFEAIFNSIFNKVIKIGLEYVHQNSIENTFYKAGITLTPETIHQSYYQSMYNILFTYAQNVKAIIVGTTNLDELAYIGWFGKQSDMVVDLQIISDMHKFEINYLLKAFNLNDVANEEPTGDIPGGKVDTEYFECDYDTLAYYSYCKCNNLEPLINAFGVEKLHRKNAHKYQGQTFNPVFLIDKSRFFIYKDSVLNHHSF